VLHKKIGDPVAAGESLLTIHYNSEERLPQACAMLRQAYRITGETPRTSPPLIRRVIEG
jgi:thymidine phosphorylase